MSELSQRRNQSNRRRRQQQGKYVAALPFRVLGDRSARGYVADGIAEALTAKLFGLPGVHVVSNPSAKETDLTQPLEGIAHNFGVNLLVTGTIQGSGENMRVTANVDDVSGRRTVERRIYRCIAEPADR